MTSSSRKETKMSSVATSGGSGSGVGASLRHRQTTVKNGPLHQTRTTPPYSYFNNRRQPLEYFRDRKRVMTLLKYSSLILVPALFLAARTYWYMGMRFVTPHSESFSVISPDDPYTQRMEWGAYRPGLYFGMRSRRPNAPLMGLMWYTYGSASTKFRHWCSQDDHLDKYGWARHDGVSFGSQYIIDGFLNITTSYVKLTDDMQPMEGGSDVDDTRNGTRDSESNVTRSQTLNKHAWIARVKFSTISPSASSGANNPTIDIPPPIILLLYVGIEGSGYLRPIVLKSATKLEAIEGSTSDIASFNFQLRNVKKSHAGRIIGQSYLASTTQGAHHYEDAVYHGFTLNQDAAAAAAATATTQNGQQLNAKLLQLKGILSERPTIVVSEYTFHPPQEFEIRFSETDEPVPPITTRNYEDMLMQKWSEFDARFERTFNLTSGKQQQQQRYEPKQIDMAKLALSNLLGGLGYFYGSSLVAPAGSRDSNNPNSLTTREYWPAPLFTAVPARSFFPRGFLWDEGFHQLVVLHWDPLITIDVLSQWLNLMNVDGWIPREQILGLEARARVPAEFVVQRSEYANPPSFFLTLDVLLSRNATMSPDQRRVLHAFLEHAYPRLYTWYLWLNTTQTGNIPGSYRWRGRNETTQFELNPKTMTSGLDDYPRATHPTEHERHLDLYCWMAYAAGIMASIAERVDGRAHDAVHFRATERFLKSQQQMDKLHWSNELGMFADYGLHSKRVALCRKRANDADLNSGGGDAENINNANNNGNNNNNFVIKRCVNEDPAYQYVDTFGYISLFPLMLRLLQPESDKLGLMLDKLDDADELWSDFGLRSLSRHSAQYFMQRNTEHDPPYWRGSIWINMNYLVLRGLHYYAYADACRAGPHADKAAKIFQELQKRLVANVWHEYERTNYIWEHYDEYENQKEAATGMRQKNHKPDRAKGKGAHPFNGWSSLILLIMADSY